MNEKREVPEVEAKTQEPKAVLVETEGFQCMAYQDCYGKWRSFYSLELLRAQLYTAPVNKSSTVDPSGRYGEPPLRHRDFASLLGSRTVLVV